MTTSKTKSQEKSNNKPSLLLFAKSEQFNQPVNIKIGAIWEHNKGKGLNILMDSLKIKLNQDKDGVISPKLYADTMFYGQPCEVAVGQVSADKDDTMTFHLNLTDLVAFENKPRPETKAKETANNQPQP